MRRSFLLGFGLGALALLLLGGCPGLPGASEASLRRFRPADELLSYFKSQARQQLRRQTRGGFGDPMTVLGLAPSAGGVGDAAGESGGASFSTTNLQEPGVDESDVFKSDGTHFYIARGRTLRIVRANPTAALAQVGALEFDSFITALYLTGDNRLIALGQKDLQAGGDAGIMIWPPYHVGASTVVYSVNIANPAAPTLVARNELDGSLVSSRLTGGRLILVLTIAPQLPADPTPRAIDALTLDDILPRQRSAGARRPLVPPENWYRPETPDGYYATAILTLDAADITRTVGAVAVMAAAETIYASTQAVYLTDSTHADDGTRRTRTALHKFRFNAGGVAEYVASGTVPGRPLNQFSLNEFEGHLRLATHIEPVFFARIGIGFREPPTAGATAQAAADDAPHNAVYVLRENAGKLVIRGRVEGIAPNERLYAARFLGPRGYLVTFLQIDPLFVLDLSDPAAPAVIGELKVPGFSDYLHPLGANRLIGVGRTVRSFGNVAVVNAVQLSLFDTTDPGNPTLVQQLELGGSGSWTDVSYTHKAFTFLPESSESGLLVLPVWLQAGTAGPGPAGAGSSPGFEGIVCYRVTPSGFSELGRVPAVRSPQSLHWWNPWRRGAFIGDTVFAITPAGVTAASGNPFSTITSVNLPDGPGDNGGVVFGGF